MRVYLDHNAGSMLRPRAQEAMLAALADAGNASSIHAEGRRARARIEAARGPVSRLVGGSAKALVFTSGASEAIQTVLSPVWRSGGGERVFRQLLVGATEHPSVLAGGRFAAEAVTAVKVDAQGRIDLEALSDALAAGLAGAVMVAVQAANSETGVVQPLDAVSRQCKAHEALFVVDAVQAAGRMDFDMTVLGADAVILSSHKIGGPQGAGAYVTASEDLRPMPLIAGGGQEGRQRAGTENVAAIAGFGAAAEDCLASMPFEAERLCALRDRVEAALCNAFADCVVFGAGALRLPNTLSFAVPGIAAETALMALDLEGLSLSSGSACSSGKVGRSSVLQAMGVADELLGSALRISLGWSTQDADMISAIHRLTAALSRIRARQQHAPAA